MPRTRWILASLLLIPLADALLLVVVSDFIGWQATVALVVLTGLVGMLLVRAEGRHTLRALQQKVETGQLPTNQVMDGGLLLVAGAFLLTPGLVTDTIGFLLAVPLTRYPIREVLKRVVVKPYLDRRMEGFVSGNVWTAGFPQEEFGGGPSGSSGGSESGGGSGPGSSDYVDVDGGTVDDDRR
ncbi:FxsA family protein [Salinigranum salinum]|uniref:FxsA family protein n=1 Tax=Salinigranum salinum TaxID=1364937 RepID=UPI001260FC38|nr:FxsA family protein [Salinigranum salinum]